MPYSHGVRFEPEVPFVNLQELSVSTDIHSAHQAARPLIVHEEPAFASPPVLRRGRAGALLDGFLLVVFKALKLSKTAARSYDAREDLGRPSWAASVVSLEWRIPGSNR